MTRALALPVALLATVIFAVAADQSQPNKSDEPDAFDIEPPILKQNLSNDLMVLRQDGLCFGISERCS